MLLLRIVALLSFLFIPIVIHGVQDVSFSTRASFSIRSSLYCNMQPGREPRPLKNLIESYSEEQLRAQITVETPSENNVQEFTYDKSIEKGLTYNIKSKTCTRFLMENLFEELCQYDDIITELERLLKSPISERFQHVVGPARILLLLSRYDQKDFYRMNLKNKISIDGHDVMLFKLRPLESAKFDLEIFYPIISVGDTPVAPAMDQILPLRVDVISKSKTTWSAIYFEYYGYKSLGGTYISLSSAQHEALDLSKMKTVHDDFMFPIGYKCSIHLRDPDPTSNSGEFAKLPDLFADYYTKAAQFSFHATTHDTAIGRYFVAYDGSLGMIRIDTKILKLKNVDKIKESTKILDLKANRKYIVASIDESDNEKVSSVIENSDRPVYDSGCSVHLLEEPGASPEPFSFEKFIFGQEQFVYIGRARVRGINALVYEAESRYLPKWFSQPMLYRKSGTDLYFTRENFRAIDEQLSGQTRLSLSVQVYIANEKGNMRPLKLELIDMSISFESSYRTLLKVDFDYFHMDLTDAPDGTPSHHLFELDDSCSSYIKTEKYSQVDVLVETIEKDALDFHRLWQERRDHASQLALMSAIRDTLKVQPVMLSDFQVKPLAKDLLSINFRLAEHPAEITNIDFLGNAVVDVPYGDIVRVRADSPQDCLWVIGKTGASKVKMLYSQRGKVCLFETDAFKAGEADQSKQKHFSLNPNGGNEYFLISTERDLEIEKNLLNDPQMFIRQSIDISRWLQVFNPTYSTTIPVKTQIRNLRVRHENNLLDPFDRQETRESTATKFPGFSLTYTSNMQPIRYESDGPVTPEECRAFCLEQVSCRWYSVCRTGRNSCVLSESAATVKELGKYLREFRRDTSYTRLSKPKYIYGETVLELESNPLCELRAKIEMDFFRESLASFVDLEEFNILPDEKGRAETCASLCLQANVNLIQASSSDVSVLASQFCTQFMLIERPFNQNQADYISKLNTNSKAQAYCLFSKDIAIEAAVSIPERSPKFRAREFRFDFSKLFRKHPAYLLIRSELSNEEELAVDLSRRSDQLDMKHSTVLDKAYETGKNIQQFIRTDELQCAAQCFLQKTQLRPACKSFDIIDGFCVFNTQDMDHSLKHKLVAVSAENTGVELDAHYEFAVSFLRDTSLKMSSNGLSLQTSRAQPMLDQAGEARSGSSGSFLAVLLQFTMVTVGLLTGLYCGQILAARLFGAGGFLDADFRSQLIHRSSLDLRASAR